jgi:hypothetical protein
MFAPRGCERVILRAPVVFRRAPLRRKQSAQLEAVQSGIERAFLHAQDVLRSIVNKLRDRVAVQRATAQRPKDQHIERALNQVARFAFIFSHNLLMGVSRFLAEGASGGERGPARSPKLLVNDRFGAFVEYPTYKVQGWQMR